MIPQQFMHDRTKSCFARHPIHPRVLHPPMLRRRLQNSLHHTKTHKNTMRRPAARGSCLRAPTEVGRKQFPPLKLFNLRTCARIESHRYTTTTNPASRDIQYIHEYSTHQWQEGGSTIPYTSPAPTQSCRKQFSPQKIIVLRSCARTKSYRYSINKPSPHNVEVNKSIGISPPRLGWRLQYSPHHQKHQTIRSPRCAGLFFTCPRVIENISPLKNFNAIINDHELPRRTIGFVQKIPPPGLEPGSLG